jgi:hypothetical protein
MTVDARERDVQRLLTVIKLNPGAGKKEVLARARIRQERGRALLAELEASGHVLMERGPNHTQNYRLPPERVRGVSETLKGDG